MASRGEGSYPGLGMCAQHTPSSFPQCGGRGPRHPAATSAPTPPVKVAAQHLLHGQGVGRERQPEGPHRAPVEEVPSSAYRPTPGPFFLKKKKKRVEKPRIHDSPRWANSMDV